MVMAVKRQKYKESTLNITKRGRLEQNKLENKRLTQDFFVRSKKSITSHRTERKLGKV